MYLQPIVDGKKNNYSNIFKYKTKSNLKFRICCKKYYECYTFKKNKNNNKSLVSKLLLVFI